MSHSQFHRINWFILRHAWLNLWDKHMTTGRINQVSYYEKEVGFFCANHPQYCLEAYSASRHSALIAQSLPTFPEAHHSRDTTMLCLLRVPHSVSLLAGASSAHNCNSDSFHPTGAPAWRISVSDCQLQHFGFVGVVLTEPSPASHWLNT
jgi:hypothetical protein